jgi:hypothetical protein
VGAQGIFPQQLCGAAPAAEPARGRMAGLVAGLGGLLSRAARDAFDNSAK